MSKDGQSRCEPHEVEEQGSTVDQMEMANMFRELKAVIANRKNYSELICTLYPSNKI
jgi:hypothetical protein